MVKYRNRVRNVDKGYIALNNKENKLRFKSITQRWGGERIQHEYEIKIQNLLNNFSKEEQAVLIQLLTHFDFYTDNRIEKKVIELYKKFSNEFSNDSPSSYLQK